MNKKVIIDGLNNLLQKNVDAEKGYRQAGLQIDRPGMRALFNQKSIQRYHFGEEIKSLIHSLEGHVKDKPSLEGRLHRTWMDFKDYIMNNSDTAILEEIERGEKVFLEEYEAFLKDQIDLPAHMRRILQRQYNMVQKSLERVELMEEVMSS